MLAPFSDTPTFLGHEVELQLVKRNLDLSIPEKLRPAIVFIASEYFKLVGCSLTAPSEWHLASRSVCWTFIEMKSAV